MKFNREHRGGETGTRKVSGKAKRDGIEGENTREERGGAQKNSEE
jgi:hypothetical protein